MKASFILRFAKEKRIILAILISLVSWIYPEITLAHSAQSTGQNQALVFEIKLTPTQNSQKISDKQLAKDLENYLSAHDSPLAPYAEEIVKQPQWERALAISYVESNFGKFCANNNCSGIGVSPSHPSWHKYPTKLDWFKDMSQLLEKPIYKEKYKTCNSMRGIYVVPGSDRWVNGCNKVSNELLALSKPVDNNPLHVAVANPNAVIVVQGLTVIQPLAINR